MSIRETLTAIASQRVLILDGAMGSMIQSLKLTEADFRGSRFATHHTPLAGCIDLLCLTMPQTIGAVHEAYLEAGADIIETCSFNATAVSLADYGLEHLAWEISAEAAAIASAVCAGHRSFKRIATITEGNTYIFPCGTCRQMLCEFSPSVEVLCARASDGRFVSYPLSALFPMPLSSGDS